jgi:DNA replication and repair protein RecF
MMFQLKKIVIFQFKNYVQTRFAFSERLIGICGNNGMGKTNLLDAIYYLCFTKSYFTKSDIMNVLQGAQGFRVAGSFLTPPTTLENESVKEVVGLVRENGKKEFSVNGIGYDKLIHHIGQFCCVMIAPDDVLLITGGSEERRRFMDALLCQIDAVYLQHLIDYNRIVQQRNSYLKSQMEKGNRDVQLLDVYDEQLIKHGTYIFEKRTIFLNDLIPLAQKNYTEIAGTTAEPVLLTYETALLKNDFAQLLRKAREKDMVLQRTTQGIHRDDLQIRFSDQSFKAIASQGQRKSLLFALKLAEFELLKKHKLFTPILLLDDVFEKLDAARMKNLFQKVCVNNNGQIFITDTHKERLEVALRETGLEYEMVELGSKSDIQ